MAPAIPGDGKSRQSSAGKSFFSRKKDKNNDASIRETISGPRSLAGSQSSRYTQRSSIISVDKSGVDPGGLDMKAGIVTAIPYDSSPANGKAPVPVDYYQREGRPVSRKEPQPHHLNKPPGGSDYHQYPAWAQLNSSSGTNVSGPRPPPHNSSTTTVNSGIDRG